MNPIQWVRVKMLPKKNKEVVAEPVAELPPPKKSRKAPKKTTKPKKSKKSTPAPKKKTNKTPKQRLDPLRKHLEKETKGKDNLIKGFFKDQTGELCVVSSKPINEMTPEEHRQFQQEAVLALLRGDVKKMMKNLQPGKLVPSK